MTLRTLTAQIVATAYRWGRGQISQYPARVWLWLILPVTVAWVLIAGVGPQLQAHTLPLSSSVAPTIYDSVYPDSLARLPSLHSWLMQSFSIVTLIVGASTSLYAARGQSVQSFILRSAIAFSVSYSVLDAVYVVFGLMPVNVLASGIIANIAGGVAVAFIACLILAIYRAAGNNVEGRWSPNLAAALGAVMVGLSVSILSYAAIFTFYRPLEAPIDFTVSLPFEGEIAPISEARKVSGDERRVLMIVPERSTASSINAVSPNQAGEVNWSRLPGAANYDLHIRASSGCVQRNEASSANLPPVTFGGVDSVKLPNGTSEITIASNDPLEVSTTLTTVATMWHPKPNPDGRLNLRFFTDREDQTNVKVRDEVTVSATTYLFDKKASRIAESEIAFVVDDRVYTIVFSPSVRQSAKNKIVCLPVSISKQQEGALKASGRLVVPVNAVVANVSLTLVSRSDNLDVGIILPLDTNLTLSDSNGWLSINNVTAGTGYLGRLGVVSFSGDVRSFTAYGQSVASGHDAINAIGDFAFYRTSDDGFRISGVASAAFRNSERINKTRWEATSEEAKFFLIPILLGGLGLVSVFSRRTLRGRMKENPKSWTQ